MVCHPLNNVNLDRNSISSTSLSFENLMKEINQIGRNDEPAIKGFKASLNLTR